MKPIPIDEATIRRGATPDSFSRGESYVRQGAVLSVVLRGDQLQAEVAGSQVEPYVVQISISDQGVSGAWCSCPYDWGGWCKHIVAVLLTCLHAPEQIEERQPVDELLAGLDETQLRTLVRDLVADNPHLVDWIEAKLAVAQLTSFARDASGLAPRRLPPVNVDVIRRQVRNALHSLDRMRPSEAYGQVGSVVGEVQTILRQARLLIEAGDGTAALHVLEAITEAYMADCWYLDDSSGYVSGFFSDLGEAWTEAALTAELPEEERQAWAERLTAWQSEISDYGVDGAFDPAQAALLMGWDYPALKRAMEGEITELGAWEVAAPWYADQLAVARLKVLDRQGRYEEYLNLAQAEGQLDRYVLMLAHLGRLEVLEEQMPIVQSPSTILLVAKMLQQQGEIEAALRIAEPGLAIEQHYGVDELAEWLSHLAQEAGRPELALAAAKVAFRHAPDRNAYGRVAALAGERWPAVREEVLADLRRQSSGSGSLGAAEVFLSEGLWDDAIAVAESDYSYGTVEMVADAVIQERPTWVVETSLRRAAGIIEPGSASHYDTAIAWLRRARDAFLAAGLESDWEAYLVDLRAHHGRKYKLMRLLDDLLAS